MSHRHEVFAILRKVKSTWHDFRKNKLGILGLVILLFFITIALLADNLAPYGEWELRTGRPFERPSSRHPLGTDELGRDILSLVIYGTRISLLVGMVAALFSAGIGGIIGLCSGYFGGLVDDVLMRVTDSLLVIPTIVLTIIMAALLGPNIFNIILVIVLVSWPPIARIIRSQVLSIKEQAYVEAAHAIGCSSTRILFRHILPNALPMLIVNMVFQVSSAILAEAALSFLGLGDPHHTSWGMLLHYAWSSGALAAGSWWYVVPPGLCILALVIAFAFIGYALDEVLNPRLRRT